MKKLILTVMTAMSVLCVTSCTTVKKTATTQDVSTVGAAGGVADVVVSHKKIGFSSAVPRRGRRGGSNSVKATAVAEALKANGNADILVNPQFDMKIRRGSIREITVTGYPATYKNFRKLPCEAHK